jgi:hypothetical protein
MQGPARPHLPQPVPRETNIAIVEPVDVEECVLARDVLAGVRVQQAPAADGEAGMGPPPS